MSRPSIRLRALAAALAVTPLVALGTGAGAQLPPLLGTTTTAQPGAPSPPPPPPPSSSTTTTPSVDQGPSGPAEREDQGEPPAEVPVPGGDGALPLDEAIERFGIPDWAREKMDSVRRSGANSTRRVLEALRPLLAFGFTPGEAARIGLGKFPVDGEATFADGWWHPRYTPEFHLHEGTDVFAAFGTPVTAPFDGVLTMGEGRVGGLYTYLTTEDRTCYYFSHLDTLPEVGEDRRITDPAEVARYAFHEYDRPVAYRVSAGDVIGTVGDTGNARSGRSHLHFEVRPGCGEAVNPKPILDGWLAEAEAAVHDVVALYTSRGPKAVVSTQRTRAAGPGQFAAPSRPLAAEILGVSSVGPGTGVQIVTEEVVRAVSRIDWDARRKKLSP